MAAIAQHRPRAGSGEVNIQCIRVGPLADRILPEWFSAGA